MDRGSTSAFQTEIVKDQNQPCHLIAVELTSGTVYLTDAFKDIIFEGDTYQAVGTYLGVSEIEESANLIVSSMVLSLSNIDQTWIAALLSEDYIDRTIKVYLGFLDSVYDLLSDPILVFEGRIDQPLIDEDPDAGTSTIAIKVTNAWVDFQRITGRHANHEEQQIHYSGDKGFEFASEVVQDLRWGQPT